ncbi:MAG TPA: hypothetical protein VK906_15845, partial [Egicoccus sp.]
MGHKVAALVIDDANPFEFAVAAEVFGIERPEIPEWDYEFELVASGRRVTLHGGAQLHTTADLDALTTADTVVVPAGNVFSPNDPDIVAAVAAA